MSGYGRPRRQAGARGQKHATILTLAVPLIIGVAISACGGSGSNSLAVKHPAPSATVASSSLPASSPASASAPAPSPSGPAPSGSGPAPSPGGSQGATSQYLAAMNPVAGSGDLSTGSVEVNGKYYANSIYLSINPGPANVSYNLGRQWRELTATVGLSDDSPENEKVQFQIIADNRQIYNGVFELGQSKHITLNVTNVLRLELVATLVSPLAGQTNAVWGNANLTN